MIKKFLLLLLTFAALSWETEAQTAAPWLAQQIADTTWYLNQDTDGIPTRFVGADLTSRSCTQAGADLLYEDANYFYVLWISEGDDQTVSIPFPAIDGIYISRKGKDGHFWDDPGRGWETLGVTSFGDEPTRIIGYGSANPGVQSWNNSQVWPYSMVGPLQGLNPADNGGYAYRLYVSVNGPNIVGNYSVGVLRTNDPFSTNWVWGEQVLTHAQSGFNYWGPKVYMESATNWHMLVPRQGNATEGRNVRLQYYHSTDGLNWGTFILDDIFNGKGVTGAGYIMGLRKTGSVYYFEVVEGNVGPYEGSLPSVGKDFDEPWGSTISRWATNNLSSASAYHRLDYVFTQDFQAQQNLGGGENVSDFKEYLGRKFCALTTYGWKSQTGLVLTTEQYSNWKILYSGAPIKPVGNEVVRNHNVYPSYISHFFKPTQSHVSQAVVNPIEVLTEVPGLKSGSPTHSFGNAIDPTGGYAYFMVNPITDDQYHAHLFRYNIGGGHANHGIFQVGKAFVYEWIGTSGTIRLWVYGANGNIKKYRTVSNIGPLWAAIDINDMCNIGVIARYNGVDDIDITLVVDYRTTTVTVPLTTEHTGSQKFTHLNIDATKGIYFGKTFDGSLGTSTATNAIGPAVFYNGTSNATAANMLRTDIF